MTAEKIAALMADAVGNPSSGPVADAIGVMAQAVANELNPTSEQTDAQAPEVQGDDAKATSKGSTKA